MIDLNFYEYCILCVLILFSLGVGYAFALEQYYNKHKGALK